MSTALLAAIAVILCILFRILNVNSQAHKPVLHCKDTHFLETILKIAPLLQEPYVPTRLWGFSGHVQTIIHSIIGRVRCPWPIGERCYLDLKDGTTLTYDLYEPLDSSHEDDFTLAICPGIGNTSESVYIRTFVHYAQCHGYRCAVLNHVGALGSVRVTAPRIFTYGHTQDFHEMIQHILERHSNTRVVCVGFSLGGNIITKYLGEPDRKPIPHIIGGISICQGYCAIESTKWLLNWQNFRRFYLYVMTESMKTIILRHRHALLSEEAKERFKLNEHEIIAAATLPELDEAYTRKVHCFTSVTELYRWSSSLNYLKFIRKPMIFVNARDDPLVPEPLLQPIKEFACNSSHVLYLELAHGGHLGFYEGGLVYPNPVTWLDRTLVALIGSLALVHADSLLKKNIEFGPDSENSPQEADESDSSGVSEIGTSGGSTSGVVTNASSCTDTVSPHMHSVITSFSSDDTPHNEIIQISKSFDVISNPEGIAIAEEVSVSTLTPETCMGDSCSATCMSELERESHTAIINPQDMSIGSSLHHRTCASKSVGESICSTSMASE